MQELSEGEGPTAMVDGFGAALWEAKNANSGVRVLRAGAGWLQDAAVRARASTAHGLRAQAIGDGWRHASKVF